MGNKATKKVKINRDRFMEVLKERKCSIRKLGGAYSEVQRTEKTIRRYLRDGEMPPDLLDNIARYLNVHPDYLSGVYDEQADKIEDGILKKMFLTRVKPKNYPYLLKDKSDIDYPHYFEEILKMNNITMDQFRTLPLVDRILFRQELTLAIFKVIAKHFSTDSLGNDTQEELEYLESLVDDFDPFSYFAELEGVGLTGLEGTDEAQQAESDEEQKLREKYFSRET